MSFALPFLGPDGFLPPVNKSKSPPKPAPPGGPPFLTPSYP